MATLTAPATSGTRADDHHHHARQARADAETPGLTAEHRTDLLTAAHAHEHAAQAFTRALHADAGPLAEAIALDAAHTADGHARRAHAHAYRARS